MVKKILKGVFGAMGYQIHKSDPHLEFTMSGALERCRRRGVKVGTVIDVGASDGSWSAECMKYFPDANYLLIEAQQPHKPGLDKFIAGKPKASYIIAAAGRTDGKIYFDNSALFGGLASETPLEGQSIEVPVVSIDNELKRRNLPGPYLIKLDTHGFEVPILEGATESMKNASLCIIETYNYRLTNDSLRYFEMCQFMKDRGFLSIELVDFILRSRDNSLWQMDTFFIPSNSKEFSAQTFD
ncbi:MAG TPA: FkbM family methyltransferase [Cyclobacteriaceae bacterium]|nr:FkbM family methyltransferase [Cyclobacteriaceae bacterium]